jgi:WD40 repeat protein
VSAHFGLAFSRDSRTLVAGSKGTGWTVIDRTTGRTEFHRLTLDDPVHGVMLRPDADEYLMVLRSGKVHRYDPLTGTEAASFTVTGHTAGEWAMSADGSRMVFARGVSGATERLKVWGLPQGNVVADSPAEPPPRCVAISSDGQRVAWAADGTRKRPGHTLCVWDVAANKVNTTAVPDRPLRVLAFSPDGTRIAGGSDQGAVHVWEVDGGKWLAGRDTADGWARPARVLAFAPDGKRLAAGLVDGSVRVWDTTDRTPELVLTCDRTPVFAVAFSPDGRTLAAGSSRGSTVVWDLAAE